jgi:hypothetical protein
MVVPAQRLALGARRIVPATHKIREAQPRRLHALLGVSSLLLNEDYSNKQ